tara:strand:+ start:147 stop:2045 length:1899 start_codon:yes stop_codon:yes gene_type:complete
MKKLLLLSVLLIPACGKNQNTNDTGTIDDPSVESIHGRIAGIVEDQSGNPIANVEVSTTNENTTTASDGSYTLLDVQPADNIVIKFSKPGFASNYEVTTLINWETVTSNTTLLEIDGSATLSSTEASQINVGDVSIDFQANSFIINETQALYNGTVLVEVTHVDPTTNEIEGAPRDLSAIGFDGSSQLVSYGMIDVTLYGESGELLTVVADKPANVMIPITNGSLNADYQLSPGDSQSTWSFNPEQGIWVEESVGTITGDESGLFFTFEAPHFSWWNCDQGFVPSCATGRVVDYLGFPVRSAEVTCAGDQTTSTVSTDEDGYYVCSVMVGDYVSFTGTTFVAGKTWHKTKGSIFMDSEGSSAADCEPIPDIQIDVCRIAGTVNVENYEAVLDENSSATVSADGLSAVFWEPPGDIAYCNNPLDSLQAGECWSGTNDEIVSNFPESSFPGIPASARSAGLWFEVSNARSTYRMERSLEGVLPFYAWETHSDDNGDITTDRPEFNEGDLLTVSAAGDYNAYFGPWAVTDIAAVPSQVFFSSNSLTANGGNLLVDYANASGDDVFFAAMAGNEQVLCRFEDAGAFSVPGHALSNLPAGFGGASVFNLSMELAAGPDGLPVYTQIYSGESVPLSIE